MIIYIDTIPHAEQRYPTVGDWHFINPDLLYISISEMQNQDYEFLVGIHEFIEAYLAHKRGIKEEDVDAFDIEFEKNRKAGDFSEPGNHPECPVYKEHQIATQIEFALAKELGVNWDEYDKTVCEL